MNENIHLKGLGGGLLTASLVATPCVWWALGSEPAVLVFGALVSAGMVAIGADPTADTDPDRDDEGDTEEDEGDVDLEWAENN